MYKTCTNCRGVAWLFWQVHTRVHMVSKTAYKITFLPQNNVFYTSLHFDLQHVSFWKYSNLNFRVFTVRDTKIGMLSCWKKSLLLILSSTSIRNLFMRTYASSRVKRKSFYRKSELQMFFWLLAAIMCAQWPIWMPKSVIECWLTCKNHNWIRFMRKCSLFCANECIFALLVAVSRKWVRTFL